MNILHIMQCANLGGMEQSTLIRIHELIARGNQCRLVSLNPIGELGPILEAARVPSQGLEYKGQWGWRSIPKMWRAFREEPNDAILMTGLNVAAIIALGDLCSKKRLLCIHYHHSGVKTNKHWRFAYRMATSKFRRIAFCSDYIREEAEEICPFLRGRTITLRNPFRMPEVPDPESRSRSRNTLGLAPGDVAIGNAGWLIDRKRWDVFFHVAGLVAKRVPNAVFVVAGDGPRREELNRLCIELGIAERVRWMGWQSDLSAFYSGIDVMLFNSDWDAMGRSPIEAISYGVPVVASVLNGGLREAIDSSDIGFLKNEHDIEWLATKVTLLARDRALASRMAAIGRARMCDLGSPMHDCDRIIELLS